MNKFIKIIEFFGFYFKEVILSNFRVARIALTPDLVVNSKFVSVPLEPGLTNYQLMLLTNLIAMTPGSICVDISEDRNTLDLHVISSEDDASIVCSIKNDFERRVINVS